jgi:hypothetical protein
MEPALLQVLDVLTAAPGDTLEELFERARQID